MQIDRTKRGFEIVRFTDRYGAHCSIQQSSVMGDNGETPGATCLWIGPSEAKPLILASKAAEHGIHTAQTTGWIPFPVPDDVLMTTRMHVGREQVEAIIEHLQRWLATGSLTLSDGS